MINKVNGLLGLSAKSGNILAGTDLVLDEMLKKRVKLVILASDASEKTKKKHEVLLCQSKCRNSNIWNY